MEGGIVRKNALVLFLGIALVAGFTANGFANETKEDAFTKFGRGFSNILTSPFELYIQPMLMSKNHEPAQSIGGGLAKGFAMMLVRIAGGIYEIVTFPVPIPKDYAPILNPATPFTDWNSRRP